MIEYLKLFAEWINSPKTLSVFGAAAAFPLFLPACWLQALHLSDAIDRYRPLFWLIFLVCVIGLLFDGGKSIVNRERFKYRLRHLSRDEQEFLSHFVHEQVSTRAVLPYEARGASALVADGILFLAPTIGQPALEDGVIWYTIKPWWILRYLQKHSLFLGGFATRQSQVRDEENSK